MKKTTLIIDDVNANKPIMSKAESIITTEIEKLNKEEKENLKGTKGQDRYAIKQEYMYKRSSLQSILDKIKGDDK